MSRIGPADLGQLDRESDVPLYRQIADRLLRLIEDDVLISGDMLPSGPELSRHFAVAPMTVREALNALRADGRIVSEKGRGVYVSAPPPLRTALQTLGIRDVERSASIGEMPALPTAMPSREAVDDAIQRVGLVVISYYPEVHVDEPDYAIDHDVDWCLEPLTDVPAEQQRELREAIGRTITNPTAHRARLFQLLLDLVPADE